MGGYFKAIVLLIVLVALVTFGIQNHDLVKLHYYFGLSSMPLPVYGLVYASIIIGIFIGMLIGVNNRLSQRKKIKVLQNENNELKEKVGEEKEAEKPRDEQPEDTIEDNEEEPKNKEAE